MQVEDIITVSQYRNSLHLRQQWVAALSIKLNKSITTLHPDIILDWLFFFEEPETICC